MQSDLPASLTYADSTAPGIGRRRRGRVWHYHTPAGERVVAAQEIARLNSLAVPPAYRDVWYCPDPRGHLQALGYDARGRRQYRYHPDFRSHREADKFDRCAGFGERLPKLRERVAADLELSGIPRDRVLAAVVRLLDEGHVRIGNTQYAEENDSYGATTLRTDHSRVRGERVRLAYRGKSGKDHVVDLKDGPLARIVRRCQDLPGQALFQFVGDDGEPHAVGSGDVNGYIKETMGDAYSAKHFRTWGASVIAYEVIAEADPVGTLSIKALVRPVADALGNTPTIARKSYIHPAVVELVTKGGWREIAGTDLPRRTRWLLPAERALLAFLGG